MSFSRVAINFIFHVKSPISNVAHLLESVLCGEGDGELRRTDRFNFQNLVRLVEQLNDLWMKWNRTSLIG